MTSTQSLSPDEARKIALLSQGVLTSERSGRAIDATRLALQRMGYVQIDTISVVARAHLHTLWNRNPRFKPAMLDRLVADRTAFEYWSHAAAYLPIEDYRYCLPRMRAERRNKGHWHEKNPGLMREVLRRIEQEGPLMARDFEDPAPGKKAMWEWKPAKYALEQLFMEGKIMATRREGFNKVYDLTDRVLPESVDRREPAPAEFARHLIKRYLGAHGIGRPAEITHLRKGWGSAVTQCVEEMLEAQEIEQVNVRDKTWLMMPDTPDLLARSLPRSKCRLLSPFDNLVIQRNRLRDLFNFDYQIECYVTEAKRRYGYFVLPVLWRGRMVARTDLKAHRQSGVLEVRSLHLEPGRFNRNAFFAALADALIAFARFDGCESVATKNDVDPENADLLRRELAARNVLVHEVIQQ